MGIALDRISELPDTIRIQILCLLPRKFAARTSVLSRRWGELWRYRWPYVTSLVFGEEFGRGLSADEFAGSIDEFLKLRGNSKVETFHLFFNSSARYHPNAVSWIEYVVNNGVEELYLDFSQGLKQGKGFQMPNSLLRGESLTTLSLVNCELRQTFNFKRLKFLETVSLRCVNATDEMVLDITVNCPFLEKLDLSQCPQLRSIKVCGQDLRLKSLIVANCSKACEIEVSAPSLTSFHFNGEFLGKYLFRDISSLAYATMNSLASETGRFSANWGEIMRDVAHVKVLTLCSRAVQQIALSKQSTPIVLRNLQELQLLMDLMTETNLSDIFAFFGNCHCPKLEKVYIELPTGTKDPLLEIFLKVPVEEPHECDFSTLKLIRMNNFKGYKYEMDLVRFFLEKVEVLQSIILVTSQEMEAMTQLNLLQKVFANVNIVVTSASELC